MTGATGPAGISKTFITFNPGANYVNGDFQFFGTQNSNESAASILITQPGILSDLFISNTFSAGPFTSRRLYIVNQNQSHTLLQVSLDGTSTQVSNTTDNVPVSPGDLISLEYTEIDPMNTRMTTGSITFTLTS